MAIDAFGAMLNLAGIKPTDEDKRRILTGIQFIAEAPSHFARLERKLDLILANQRLLIDGSILFDEGDNDEEKG